MKNERILFCASLLAVLIITNFAFAYYDVIDLGTLGGSYSKAWFVNDGKIAGWANNASANSRACLFDSTGSGANTDLGTLGGNNSCAYSIDTRGKLVLYITFGAVLLLWRQRHS